MYLMSNERSLGEAMTEVTTTPGQHVWWKRPASLLIVVVACCAALLLGGASSASANKTADGTTQKVSVSQSERDPATIATAGAPTKAAVAQSPVESGLSTATAKKAP
jgi:hypothetical protein